MHVNPFEITTADPRERSNAALVARVHSLGVPQNDVENEALVELIKDLVRAKNELEDARKKITDPLRQSLNAAMEQTKAFREPLERAERYARSLGVEYRLQQEMAREDALAQLEQRDAELEVAAIRAADEGRYEDATDIQEQRMKVAVPAKVERVAGTSFSTRWHAECFDLIQLAAAVLRGDVSPDCLRANQPAIDKLAREHKTEGVVIPGVRFIGEKTMAVSAR